MARSSRLRRKWLRLGRYCRQFIEISIGAAPGAVVIVVGYPQLFPSRQSQVLGCDWLNNEARAGLNVVTAEAKNMLAGLASIAHVDYVSTLAALAGHELCTRHSWMNPIELGQNGNAHPNRSGQEAIERVVAAKVEALGFRS